jgi:outer membrane lipoprotein-sorting protein
MKKRVTAGLTGLILFGAIVSFVHGQSAEGILDKMIKAQGGREALAAIKDSTTSGTMEMNMMGMTMSGTIILHQKEPNKMRIDMEFSVQGMNMAITQACDGERAWTTDPQSGAVQTLTGKQLEDMKKQALGIDATLNPDKYGISFSFRDREKIGDTNYLVLEQIFKDGQKITIYVDPETYLIFKSRGPGTDPQTGAEIESETFVSDYKKVGSALLPHAMSIHQNGAEFLRMTFTKITVNNNLDDALFSLAK